MKNNRRQFLFVGIIILLSIVLFVILIQRSDYTGIEDIQVSHWTPEKKVYIDNMKFVVGVADEYEQQVQGLSGRVAMNDDEGSLFDFIKSDDYGIWMKDMNFALDIIWIDENLNIVHIERNILPESYPEVYRSKVVARYVLEINAGLVDKSGIAIGSHISIK